MDSTALTGIRGTGLLSCATTTWQRSREGLAVVIAPRTGAFQGGAMAVTTMAPVPTYPMVTDHDPLLGPLSCRPPV